MNLYKNTHNYFWNTEDLLGKGAFGCVYKGMHKKTGELVAIKTFTSQLYPIQLLRQEFEIVEDCDHKNIVKMIAVEHEIENRRKVLIMELCEGGSLSHILEDPRHYYGFQDEEFMKVLFHIVNGMQYLRNRNISHRDLKPDNIMQYIGVDGKTLYKLSDFGSAKYLPDSDDFTSVHGTPEYLHPNLYARAFFNHPETKPSKATTDLWSIGVTLYQVATGKLPFRPYGCTLSTPKQQK